MILRRFRRAAAPIAAALALLQPAWSSSAQGRPAARTQAARPALWVLRSPRTTIWLFGTIHALPPHFEWETPAIRAAVARSDRLVLEAVIDQDQAKSGAAMLAMGTATTPQPPLLDRVAPRLRKPLAAMVSKSGAPLASLNRMKTWAAAMVLFGVTVSDLGVTATQGVEEQLKAQFRAAGKPVEGLETLEQQLGFFDTLDEARQRAFLASVIDEKGNDAADFGTMLGAWAHGDERRIARSFDKDMKRNDVLRAVLLSRRNAHWADALVRRLRVPGTQFVAVGAGHLTGGDSVQTMLAKRGYRVTRVQ